MKNKDLPRGLAVGLCIASGLSDHRPSQKLYVPPTTLSAVLAAARLATSSDYFQWPLSLRQKVWEEGRSWNWRRCWRRLPTAAKALCRTVLSFFFFFFYLETFNPLKNLESDISDVPSTCDKCYFFFQENSFVLLCWQCTDLLFFIVMVQENS